MTKGDRRYRLDEEVDLHADLLSGALNGDRRGGDEPTFVEIGIVVKDRWGQLKKVMRPARGGEYREVTDARQRDEILEMRFEDYRSGW
jgi:hypothetical protein